MLSLTVRRRQPAPSRGTHIVAVATMLHRRALGKRAKASKTKATPPFASHCKPLQQLASDGCSQRMASHHGSLHLRGTCAVCGVLHPSTQDPTPQQHPTGMTCPAHPTPARHPQLPSHPTATPTAATPGSTPARTTERNPCNVRAKPERTPCNVQAKPVQCPSETRAKCGHAHRGGCSVRASTHTWPGPPRLAGGGARPAVIAPAETQWGRRCCA